MRDVFRCIERAKRPMTSRELEQHVDGGVHRACWVLCQRGILESGFILNRNAKLYWLPEWPEPEGVGDRTRVPWHDLEFAVETCLKYYARLDEADLHRLATRYERDHWHLWRPGAVPRSLITPRLRRKAKAGQRFTPGNVYNALLAMERNGEVRIARAPDQHRMMKFIHLVTEAPERVAGHGLRHVEGDLRRLG